MLLLFKSAPAPIFIKGEDTAALVANTVCKSFKLETEAIASNAGCNGVIPALFLAAESNFVSKIARAFA